MSRKTIAVAAIVLSTCLAAACRAPGIAARSEPAPRARAPQEGHAEGDLLQELKQVQETLSRVESNQRAQSSELAGRIGDVDRMVQQVEKQMYGPSPEQLQLEQDRLGKQTVFGLAGVGILVGLVLIVAADKLINRESKLDVADLDGADARKALLILGIMTAHSFAEGIGVGVSFGGGEELGFFITAAIAVHNIPEGLAISLVLIPRGTRIWKAAGWSIFTSLPQPLMAVPAFLFVLAFEPFLPVGLGLAAGAMIWMVFAELIPDALEDASGSAVGISVVLAFAGLLAFQEFVL